MIICLCTALPSQQWDRVTAEVRSFSDDWGSRTEEALTKERGWGMLSRTAQELNILSRLNVTRALSGRIDSRPAAILIRSFAQNFSTLRFAAASKASGHAAWGRGMQKRLCAAVADNPEVLQELPSRKFWVETFPDLTSLTDDPRHPEGKEKAEVSNNGLCRLYSPARDYACTSTHNLVKFPCFRCCD